jgi:acetylornithine deacetylase/succinyl-diaminopimelate desuccinylase-like protein
MNERLLEELKEYLRIPSISTGEGDPAALRAAAEWVAAYVRGSGGSCDVVETGRNPLVVGELAAKDRNAPTVLVYGHYDVQALGNLDEWESPPFEPEVRDGRIYARGAADNKGNFFPLMYVAREMARAGELPVNIRFLVEGEEEIGSPSVVEWTKQDKQHADCAVIFDSGSLGVAEPSITVAARGIAELKVRVTTADRDLHSGIYGGVVLNANHVLMKILSEVVPGPDALLRPELRAGVAPVSAAEMETVAQLPSAESFVRASGGRPISDEAVENYYVRNWAEPSLDVNMISGGEPRTVIPETAAAHITMRIAPGQNSADMIRVLEELVRSAAPEGADVNTESLAVDAAAFDPESPPLRIAREAIRAACGAEPGLIRLGGTVPILSPLAGRGIQTILTGFLVPDDAFHAPNESFRLKALEYGEAAARELYKGLAALR